MAPLKYGDFYKQASDLLSNDYCFDKKIKIKTKSATGTELTSEGTLKASSFSTKLTTKFNLTPSIQINKLGVSNSGRIFADAAYSNVVDGLSLSTVVEDGAKMPQVGEFSVKYAHDLAKINLKVDTVNGPTLKGDFSGNFENLHFGGEVKYNTGLDAKSGGELKDYGVGLAYKKGDLWCGLKSTGKLSGFGLGVHHQIGKDKEVGVVYTHGKGQGLEIGGSYIVDSTTKLQGKVNQDGIVAFNAHQQLSGAAKLIASAQVDAKSFGADSHKFGLQLILS
eukprot:snap_masked-scaffold_123-processed-gene-0.5-mRNA-1 protein AED:0.00 eAED:0.00 QI:0/-1/0/1/-1/1/1/0/278